MSEFNRKTESIVVNLRKSVQIGANTYKIASKCSFYLQVDDHIRNYNEDTAIEGCEVSSGEDTRNKIEVNTHLSHRDTYK